MDAPQDEPPWGEEAPSWERLADYKAGESDEELRMRIAKDPELASRLARLEQVDEEVRSLLLPRADDAAAVDESMPETVWTRLRRALRNAAEQQHREPDGGADGRGNSTFGDSAP